jgi:hypothetical protein
VVESCDRLFVIPWEMIGRFIGFTKCGSLVIRRRYKYYANDKLEREDPKFVLIDPQNFT